jgi:hypothetical protein
MITKAKKVCKSKNVLKSFIFAFTILQNSTDFAHFLNMLKQIYIFFNSEYHSHAFLEALSQIREELVNRETNACKIKLNDSLLDEADLKYDDFDNSIQSIKKSSPFGIYFAKKLAQYKQLVLDEKCVYSLKNEFYSPELFSLISDQLYIMPLWCGIMIHEISQTDSNGIKKGI